MSELGWEASWWGDCSNTFHEEEKQLVYARRWGLPEVETGHPPTFDLEGKSVVDIGGGPVSLLLKTTNSRYRAVVDPCTYPEWIEERYSDCSIEYFLSRGEDFYWKGNRLDEVWIYNVLQHVDDPQKVIQQAQSYSKAIRIWEWINIPAYKGHPHELTARLLSEWLDGLGDVEDINENGAVGTAFYGLFPCA